jgi:hypothetical protein
MRRVLFVLVGAVCAAILIFGALRNAGGAVNATSTVIGASGFPANINPLTGLPVDPGVLSHRPIAIKISNAPSIVRPQAGIADADLVFEHVTEGQLTRFTAIYWSTIPPRVGSVRSARLIDVELAEMYNAIFAFSGASGGVLEKIYASAFADRAFEGVRVSAPIFYRDDEIEVPHNMFVSPPELLNRALERGVADNPLAPEEWRGMVFSETSPANGESGSQIVIDYQPQDVEWTYDSPSGRYLRLNDGEPHTDANTGEQVSAANVVLVYAWHQFDYTIVESEWQGNKSYSVEIQIWTLGPAQVCRDGVCVRGRWNRWNEGDMLTFWTEDNPPQAIPLKPGNTWFQVVNLPEGEDNQQIITIR